MEAQFLCFWDFTVFVHRRRMKTEEKAKVVAAVWGIEFIQFLAVHSGPKPALGLSGRGGETSKYCSTFLLN